MTFLRGKGRFLFELLLVEFLIALVFAGLIMFDASTSSVFVPDRAAVFTAWILASVAALILMVVADRHQTQAN